MSTLTETRNPSWISPSERRLSGTAPVAQPVARASRIRRQTPMLTTLKIRGPLDVNDILVAAPAPVVVIDVRDEAPAAPVAPSKEAIRAQGMQLLHDLATRG